MTLDRETLIGVAHQLLAFEKKATPGPWFSVGHELYFGQIGNPNHQQVSSMDDAVLIAVMRSWIKDFLVDYLFLTAVKTEAGDASTRPFVGMITGNRKA